MVFSLTTMDPIPTTTEALLERDAWVRALAAAVVRDGSAADDAAQETWLRVLSARVGGPIRVSAGWFVTLVHNVARNTRRDEARRESRQRQGAQPERDPAPGPLDFAVYEERRAELVALVSRLPDAQRDVVLARFWEGLEPAEIAERNGEAAAAVRQRLRRAVVALRSRLDRSESSSARAWLAPLLVGGGLSPPVSAPGAAAPAARVGGTAAGSVATLTGMVMKKLNVAAVLGLVGFVVVGGVLWWGLDSASDRAPVAEPSALSTAGADARAPGEVARPEEVEGARTTVSGRAAPDSTKLVDATGDAVAGVAYWLDERPYRHHPAQPPADAPRTDAEGAFDLAAEGLGEGGFLWFEVSPTLALAVPRDRAASLARVTIPARRWVTAEIRGLPADQPWRIQMQPGSYSVEHGEGHSSQEVDTVDGADGTRVWVVRREVVRSGESGGASARYRVVEGLPLAFRFNSRGFVVKPDFQFVRQPEDVVSHAHVAKDVIRIRVVEADGATPSGLGGRALFVQPEDGWTMFAHTFDGGRGSVGWDRERERAGVQVVVLLEDGEVFRRPLAEIDFERMAELVLRRGTGRAAARTLDAGVLDAADPVAEVYVDYEGRVQTASQFTSFDPIPVHETRDAGAWLHGPHLVVQTSDAVLPVGAVWVVTASGRYFEVQEERLVELESRVLPSLDPRALIEELASGRTKATLIVLHEVAWPGREPVDHLGWSTVRTLWFRDTPGWGWRFGTNNRSADHRPLPESIGLRAPVGGRSRLRARVWGEGHHRVILEHAIR